MLSNNIVFLATIEKFESNHVLVNVNKFKPYKYMESEAQEQKQQMPIYYEQSGGGLQEEDFDTEVEDEDCITQKP
jgi:hypothetical protein